MVVTSNHGFETPLKGNGGFEKPWFLVIEDAHFLKPQFLVMQTRLFKMVFYSNHNYKTPLTGNGGFEKLGFPVTPISCNALQEKGFSVVFLETWDSDNRNRHYTKSISGNW